ncbi:hypothetical protein [Neomoorella thermoacetica]|uniref:hypothetical protein n=1 Tax=Neomoorella thermoacetica TaxID=1525 RepID=UPI00003CB192|nr:hypothetical protein [Moorella thermoacetica]AKX93636.1 hypothetical protein MOTHE_c08320 [Moorella thermoacetica]AKX96283.1 hypothetical protein MOTHA_c09260 [Moorella thermoacetica]OIQ55496.1 hypothetical protein MOCA_20680 [Moorella thermoacetica]OIQ55747.1 hypothetical protein MORE_06050 [Moorella thermoacetica]QDA00093.1 hypothetical protein MothHH_00941 [Moorella thermoacetica]
MDKFFTSTAWNTFILVVMGIIAFFTKEIITFFMLGFIIIILTNIYGVLKDIARKIDRSGRNDRL